MNSSRLLLCLALTSFVACGDGGKGNLFGPDRPPPSGPEAPIIPPVQPSISDAVHSGGNAHFYFLAPLVSDPVFSGIFDPTLMPVVRICEWTGAACGAEIAAFSMTEGTGGETVQLELAEELYKVEWHTDEFALDEATTYRIRVLVAGTELGHADVDVVASGKEAKNVDTNEFVALVNGRELPIKFRIEEGAVFVISPEEGGTIEALDGEVTIEVPPGAVDEETGITVESVPPADGQSVIADLGPDGLTFDPNNPVTVTLAYDESALGSVPETDLALNTFEDGEWIIVPGGSLDDLGNTVSAPFFHFSQASVGSAAKAVVCPGDDNPNTFATFEDAIAALMTDGELTVCAGIHTVTDLTVGKALTIKGKAGTRPTLTTEGARFGLIATFPSGTMTIRNLRFETLWNLGFDFAFGSALVVGFVQEDGATPISYDQAVIEDVELNVAQGSSGENAGSGAFVLASDVARAHVTFRNVTATNGVAGLSILTPSEAAQGASVDVQGSSFSSPGNFGIFVVDGSTNAAQGAISDIDIDNVNVSVPGGIGVFATGGSDVGGRVDVTNSSFSGGTLWYQNAATGLIQGNTIDCDHFNACIRVRSSATRSQAEPVQIIGNHITSIFDDHAQAIWLTELDAGPFEVRDNVIDGTTKGGDRSDPHDYTFHGQGIHFDNLEVTGVVTGNAITGAYRAFLTRGGTAKTGADDNTVAKTWSPVALVDGGQMSAHSNDFSDYIVPIDPAEPFGTGDLTCNWWGTVDGPQGVDPGIADVVYTPWATAPVAGTGATDCSGGPAGVFGEFTHLGEPAFDVSVRAFSDTQSGFISTIFFGVENVTCVAVSGNEAWVGTDLPSLWVFRDGPGPVAEQPDPDDPSTRVLVSSDNDGFQAEFDNVPIDCNSMPDVTDQAVFGDDWGYVPASEVLLVN